jgi:hypothetical protein
MKTYNNMTEVKLNQIVKLHTHKKELTDLSSRAPAYQA